MAGSQERASASGKPSHPGNQRGGKEPSPGQQRGAEGELTARNAAESEIKKEFLYLAPCTRSRICQMPFRDLLRKGKHGDLGKQFCKFISHMHMP